MEKKELAYNPYLTHFMIEHDLFMGENTPRTLALDMEVSVTREFKKNYKNSIFQTIETRFKYDINNVLNHQFFNFINEQTSIFFERAIEYMQIELFPMKLPFYGSMLNPDIIAYLAELDEEYYKANIYKSLKKRTLQIISMTTILHVKLFDQQNQSTI